MKRLRDLVTVAFLMVISFGFMDFVQAEEYSSKINEIMYETLDEAITNANNGDTIELLKDDKITIGTITKALTINGNGYTISVPRQEKTENHNLEIRNNVNFYNTKLSLKDEVSKYQMDVFSSIGFYDGSIVTLENYGMYIHTSTITVENSSLYISGTKITALMGEKGASLKLQNALLSIQNIANQNGIATVDLQINSSTVKINNCGNQGIVDSSIEMNNSNVSLSDNEVGYTMMNGNITNVQNSSTLTINNSKANALYMYSNTTFNVESGSKFEAKYNSYEYATSEKYGSTVYSKGNVNFKDGANVQITNNFGRGINNDTSGVLYVGNNTEISYNGKDNNGKINPSTGGGILNKSIATINGAKIYNNHAVTSGDDISNKAAGTITLSNVVDGLKLDGTLNTTDCLDSINGYYDDSSNNRWNAHKGENSHVVKIESTTYTKQVLNIKAAHNMIGTLVVDHVDEKDNKLKDTVTQTNFSGTKYETTKENFEGYKLSSVIGNEKGVYNDTTINVKYIYERIIGTVINRYVDTKGNELASILIMEDYYGNPYAGIKEDIKGYKLVKIIGEEKGFYIDGTIEITYVYEKINKVTNNKHGNSEITPPYTGVSDEGSINMLYLLFIGISCLIIRQKIKFNNI